MLPRAAAETRIGNRIHLHVGVYTLEIAWFVTGIPPSWLSSVK